MEEQNKKKRTIKIIIVIGVIAIAILILFGFPNYIRYKIEKQFGNPLTFLYGVHLGVSEDGSGFYDDEIDMDDNHNLNVNIHSKSTATIYIYGRFVNSADPLVVILNDKVVYNGHPSSDLKNFYSRYYIEKHFVVELNDFKKSGTNKLVLTTGNITEKYTIHAS